MAELRGEPQPELFRAALLKFEEALEWAKVLDRQMGELTAVQAGKLQRGGTRPDHPLNHTGRAQAGYTDEDIRQVVSWGYASEKTGNA